MAMEAPSAHRPRKRISGDAGSLIWWSDPDRPPPPWRLFSSVCCPQDGGHMSAIEAQIQALCNEGQVVKASNYWLSHCDQRLSDRTYLALLKLCHQKKALFLVKQLHAHLLADRKFLHGALGDYLAVTLAKCGALEEASHVFFALLSRTVFSWTALISAYTECGQGSEALRMHQLMLADGVEPDKYTFVSLLKACSSIPNLNEVRILHADAWSRGFDSDLFINNTLMSTYATCGSSLEMEDAFINLSQRDVVSWNVMLSAYFKQGHFYKALQLFRQMQDENVTPDEQTYVIVLQSCIGLVDNAETRAVEEPVAWNTLPLQIGQALHSQAKREGFLSHTFVGSAIVSLYGKCGAIMEAENVFSQLPEHDIVTFATMLLAYIKQGQFGKGLQFYLFMLEEGMQPDQQTFVAALQACGGLGQMEEATFVEAKFMAVETCKALHLDVCRRQVASSVFIGSTLVSVYSKCDCLADAEIVFDELTGRNVVSWNAMLSAYVDQGNNGKAVRLYRQMEEENVGPNQETFLIVLQACAGLVQEARSTIMDEEITKMGIIEIGQALHVCARREGFASDACIGSALLSLYGKGGSITEAECVFNRLVVCDVVAWSAMLLVYAEHGQGDMALRLFRLMQTEGVSPSPQTFMMALQSCGILAEKEDTTFMERHVMPLEIGRAVHSDAHRKGFVSDIFLNNALVHMYSKCGSIVDAEITFGQFLKLDITSWNAMLSAYVDQGKGEKTLQLYRQMREGSITADQQTFAITLQSCVSLVEMEAVALEGQSRKSNIMEIGKALHSDVRRKGFLSDLFVYNTLLSFYIKCGSIREAENLFIDLPQCDIVSWSTMISGYAERGEELKAFWLYRRMQEEGISPDQQSFAIALQLCGTLLERKELNNISREVAQDFFLEVGCALQADTQKKGFSSDVFVANLVVNMYGKSGNTVEAEITFKSLTVRNVVSWNALLSAYVQWGEAEKALNLYSQMQEENAVLDDVTVICVLQACGETGSVDTCWQIHFVIISSGYDFIPIVVNTLLSAYGSCASMADVQSALDLLLWPDIVSWSACIAGFARGGNSIASFALFEEMSHAGCWPGDITCLSLLATCSHAGLVDQGAECFECMGGKRELCLDLKHYVVLLDLLGRAGNFDWIEKLLWGMPMEADRTVWSCLLGACRTHGMVELGRLAFDHAVCVEPEAAAPYIIMSNIYNDTGRFCE